MISGREEDRVLVGPAPPEVAAPAVVEHGEPAVAARLGERLRAPRPGRRTARRDVELVVVRVGPVALGLDRDAAVADELAQRRARCFSATCAATLLSVSGVTTAAGARVAALGCGRARRSTGMRSPSGPSAKPVGSRSVLGERPDASGRRVRVVDPERHRPAEPVSSGPAISSTTPSVEPPPAAAAGRSLPL